MLGYLKLKTNNEELYETGFLSKLKEKNTTLSRLQYQICHLFYEGVVWIKKYFNIITIKQIYQAYLLIFPFESSQKINRKKLKKCMQKVKRLMNKYKIDTIVLSKELENLLGEQKQELQLEQKVHMMNGKGLMPYLIKEILEYILEKQNTKTQLEDLYICLKEVKQSYLQNIAFLANSFRTINIVTPNIHQYQKIADKLEDHIITVTNNKKKSLKKAKFIVNFDFTKQEMKKYTIYRSAVILSMENCEDYDYAGFDGLQIRRADIDVCDEIKEFFSKYHLLENCCLTTLYESIINQKQQFYKIKEQMLNDKIKIVKLYGTKGEVAQKEYEMTQNETA